MYRALSACFLAVAVAACSSSRATSSPSSAEASTAQADGAPQAEDAAQSAAPQAEAGATDDDSGTFAATTSVAELTQNNTAGCGSSAAPCTGAWAASQSVTYGSGSSYSGQTRTVDGFWDHAVSSGAQNAGSALGYVSKVPMSALLPGQAVPVWVATQNWWGSGGHIDNGEDSTRAAQIANQVADHISRGIAGQVIDWYGQGTTADKALPAIRANAEASGGEYSFAVMIDKGLFSSCGETAACLNGAIAYLVSTYTSSPAYLKDASGHPILFFFINEYYATEYAIVTSSGVNAMGTSFVMYEPNGFPGSSPASAIGEYAWVNPADGASSSQSTGTAGTFSWESDFGLQDLTSFFGAAASHASSYAVSEAHKGFDDNLATWSLNRVIDQQCGMTWLQMFDHTGAFGGSSSYEASLNYLATGKHLDMVLVDTWDDYEEGSEIETGIDNCLTELTVTLSGSTLSWSPTWGTDPMSSAVTGSEATLYGYSVYVAEQGSTALLPVSDLVCSSGSCPHSLDVSTLGIAGGPYVFYVQAVGMPSIVNTLGGPTAATYTGP
ncbi:MAG: hypothetical protein ACLQVI_22835 [Polyangiaceae bacterium]